MRFCSMKKMAAGFGIGGKTPELIEKWPRICYV